MSMPETRKLGLKALAFLFVLDLSWSIIEFISNYVWNSETQPYIYDDGMPPGPGIGPEGAHQIFGHILLFLIFSIATFGFFYFGFRFGLADRSSRPLLSIFNSIFIQMLFIFDLVVYLYLVAIFR